MGADNSGQQAQTYRMDGTDALVSARKKVDNCEDHIGRHNDLDLSVILFDADLIPSQRLGINDTPRPIEVKLKTPAVSSDDKMNGTLCFSPKSYRRTDKPGRRRDGDDDVFLSTDTLMLDLHINPKLRASVLS